MIADLFEKRVTRGPDEIAVRSAAGDLTFAVLDERAGRLARVLASRRWDRCTLSVAERTRYNRQMMLTGWGPASRVILKAARVFVAAAAAPPPSFS